MNKNGHKSQKALFIGGTGTISMAITRQLAGNPDWELYLLNRGSRIADIPEGVRTIIADINDEAACEAALDGLQFDTVCDFICFTRAQAERDYRLFKDRARQYMVISSASAYNKPASSPYISEGTTLANPYWQYSRDKIEIESYFMDRYREDGFPVTIVRPSHTYDDRNCPMSVSGRNGSWQVLKRMMEGKPVIIQGDGTSLWTMTANSDFAKGFIGLMDNPAARGEVFQITSDETLTWTQIYGCMASALGVELNPYYVSSAFLAAVGPQYGFEGGLLGDKSWSVIFNNDKLKRAVPGLRMDVRFEQGIRRTIINMLEHPELQREDPEFDAWCDRVISALETAKKAI